MVKSARLFPADTCSRFLIDHMPIKKRQSQLPALAFALLLLFALAPIRAVESEQLIFKPNDKVAFLGDSITNYGWKHLTGYVRLVQKALELHGVPIEFVPAGISGHKSNQMLARLKSDVLDHDPDWLVLSCGVNDVWHGKNGVPLEDYKTNMTTIVETAQGEGVKVVLLTATMIKEDPDSPENKKLAAYNEFLRELAAGKGCVLVDLNADMQERVRNYRETLAGAKPRNIFTTDGVHPNGEGDMMIATGILRALGFSDDKLAGMRSVWLGMDAKMGHRFPMKFQDQIWIESLDEAQRREFQERVDHLTGPCMVRVAQEMQSEEATKAALPGNQQTQ